MGHWYTQDGTPCHWQHKPDGGDRPTTLRDARKLGLYPSVTEVIRVLNSPRLVNWQMDQVILAAETLPKVKGESGADWMKRVKRDAFQQVDDAADAGGAIHDWLEDYIKTGTVTSEPYIQAVTEALALLGLEFGPDQGWIAERTFSIGFDSGHGFGGMVDVHHPDDQIVVDYKTKDFDKTTAHTVKAYDNHRMQLAAYRRGLGMPEARCINLFLSRTQPLAVPIEHSQDDLSAAWEMFSCALRIWTCQRNYKPGEAA